MAGIRKRSLCGGRPILPPTAAKRQTEVGGSPARATARRRPDAAGGERPPGIQCQGTTAGPQHGRPRGEGKRRPDMPDGCGACNAADMQADARKAL